MNQKMFVAFIDILGMSNFAKNTMAAGEVSSNPNDILNSKISDGKNFPIENYQIERLKKIAEKKLITSFDNFITFSDSIFISSTDPNLFLYQLGNFVLACFTYNANDYAYPDDNTNPSRVKIPNIIRKEDRSIEKKIQEENRYPCLFRGGLAWGQAMLIPGKSIINKKPIDANILIGKAVVDASNLEKKLKGPRIGFGEEFYSQLKEATRKYVGKTEMGHYELLWPAFTYDIGNGFEPGKFTTLFEPAVNLWNAFNHEPYGEHYFKFVKLIVLSTMKVYENTEMQNDCEAYIKSEIRRKGLELKEKALFEKYS